MSSAVILSTPGDFLFFNSFNTFLISSYNGGVSSMIRSCTIWVSTSAISGGSGLLRTSQKCYFHLAPTSLSWVDRCPCFSLTLFTSRGRSLQIVFVTSYTPFMFPLLAVVSASLASLSSQSRLSFLMLCLKLWSFSLCVCLNFLFTLSIFSILDLTVICSSTSFQLSAHSWPFFFFFGPRMLKAVSLYVFLKLFQFFQFQLIIVIKDTETFFQLMENFFLIFGTFSLGDSYRFNVFSALSTLCSLIFATSRLWSLPTSSPLFTLTSPIDLLNLQLMAIWSIWLWCSPFGKAQVCKCMLLWGTLWMRWLGCWVHKKKRNSLHYHSAHIELQACLQCFCPI